MRQVPVVEDHHGRLEERVTQAPAEECTNAGRVRRHEIIRDTIFGITGIILRDKITGVNGEERPTNLERKCMRR